MTAYALSLPASHRAGDAFSLRLTLGNHASAAGWTTKLLLLPAVGTKVELAGAASGNDWSFAATPAQTAGWAHGRYTLALIATQGTTARDTLAQSSLEVLPDLAAATTHDDRSFARRMLDAIEAALLGKATRQELDIIETNVYSRGQKRDKAALLEARDKFRIEVQREQAAGGRGRGGRIYMRF